MRMLTCGRLCAAFVSLVTLSMGTVLAAPAVAETAPPTPIQLFNGLRFCATDVDSPTYLSGRHGVVIQGLSPDTPDSGTLTENFQFWPVGDPAQTNTLSRQFVTPGWEAAVTIPAGDLVDGQTYAWRAQAERAGSVSAWSAPCYFTVDNTSPSKPPTITSSNYSQEGWNQGGEAIQVTFGADGVSDVEGYVYSWDGTFPVLGTNIGPYGIPQPTDPYTQTGPYVRASTLGGSTTLKLIPPRGSGRMTLTVASLDRARNRSSQATFEFLVESTAPAIKQLDPSPEFGKQATFLLQPDPGLQAASPVVGYTVRFIGRTERTINVEASASGIGKLQVTLDGNMGNHMLVTSQSASGWVSDATFWGQPFDTTPIVGSDTYAENQSSGGVGVPGTFTFTPKVKHVVSYTYSIDYGQTFITVDANDEGVAKINWTPDQSGFYDLMVYATTKDGLETAQYDYFFLVN
jgi:hypothetical protein